MKKNIRIFTDGACSSNPGKAGIGVFIEGFLNKEISQCIGIRTNNYAELMAIKKGLDFVYYAIKNMGRKQNIKIQVISDSKYSIGVITNKNWNIVANVNLILNIREKVKKIRELKCVKRVGFQFVKGHSGVKGNEIADKLAVRGKMK